MYGASGLPARPLRQAVPYASVIGERNRNGRGASTVAGYPPALDVRSCSHSTWPYVSRIGVPTGRVIVRAKPLFTILPKDPCLSGRAPSSFPLLRCETPALTRYLPLASRRASRVVGSECVPVHSAQQSPCHPSPPALPSTPRLEAVELAPSPMQPLRARRRCQYRRLATPARGTSPSLRDPGVGPRMLGS